MTGRGLGPGPVPPAPQRLHFAEAAELLSQASCSIVGLDRRGRQAVETAWLGPREEVGAVSAVCRRPWRGGGRSSACAAGWCSPTAAVERECTLSYSGLGPTSDLVLFRDWAPGPWSLSE